jgi:hypothetical protein
MDGFGIVWGPILPLELIQQLQGKDMTLKEIEGEVKAEVVKFEGWIKTLELKFFKGMLHQKIVAPHEGAEPSHAWVPVEAHDTEAPAPGEPIPAPAAPAPAAGAATGTGSGSDTSQTGSGSEA